MANTPLGLRGSLLYAQTPKPRTVEEAIALMTALGGSPKGLNNRVLIDRTDNLFHRHRLEASTSVMPHRKVHHPMTRMAKLADGIWREALALYEPYLGDRKVWIGPETERGIGADRYHVTRRGTTRKLHMAVVLWQEGGRG